MRVVCVLVVVVTGCGFDVAASNGGGGDDGGGSDGVPPASCQSWHPQHFDPCAIGTPEPGLHLTVAGSPYTYDTTQVGGTLRDNTHGVILQSNVVSMQSDSSMIAILDVASFAEDQGVTLTVSGDKPLLIASWSTITVDGLIDAGSVTAEINNTANAHIDGPLLTGAGADPAGHCGGMTGVAGGPAVASGGSGGGGGGANHGDGGHGTTGDTTFQPGGPGGTHVATAPTVLRGGCAGGASGNAATSTGLQPPATSASAAVGGAGGGSVELAALTSITVTATGTISAGGAGGAGAPQGSAVGGGGGGSGGYVGLDSAMVTVAGGTLGANGGGGGSAACYAGEGNQGSNARGAGQALGGPPGTLPGAPGSVGANLNGASATGADGCGGGGGGGGAGFIFVWSPAFTSPSAAISPPVIGV